MALAAVASMVLVASSEAAFAPAREDKIAFDRFDGVQSDVFVMNADGATLINLTNTPSLGERDPAFSPTGRHIAFTSCDLMGFECDIHLMNSDGTGRTNLTNSPAVPETSPVISPDGRRIIFLSEGPLPNLVIMDIDGSGQAILATTGVGSQVGGGHDFFPDGRRIVSTVGDSSQIDIWAMNVDGSGPVNLTNTPQDEGGPASSPDGRRIVFSGEPGDLFAMNSDGSGRVNLTNTPTFFEGGGAFSPDQRRIAFSRDDGTGGDIFVMNTDTSGLQNLTNTAPPVGESGPDWEYEFRCGKSRATIVGDDGLDRIRGTKKKDVIVANGGKDTVRGRGGNDRICLGDGRDKAVGGGGTDKCIGGKGADKGNGCEKGKL